MAVTRWMTGILTLTESLSVYSCVQGKINNIMLSQAISIEEYLQTAYSPDVDYIEGRLEDRNVGEREHGLLQFRVALLIRRIRTVTSLIETRLKVSPSRYRVPDICVYEKMPTASVLTEPPLLCIEILSPEDRLSRILTVVDDYLSMGAGTVWVLDPLQKRAFAASKNDPFTEVFREVETVDRRVVLTLETIFSDEETF